MVIKEAGSAAKARMDTAMQAHLGTLEQELADTKGALHRLQAVVSTAQQSNAVGIKAQTYMRPLSISHVTVQLRLTEPSVGCCMLLATSAQSDASCITHKFLHMQ